MLDGIAAEYLLAEARARGIAPALPPQRNRKVARDDDVALYQARHLVENGFGKLKEWRGVATRYAKNAASYLEICRIRVLALWAKII